MVRWTRVLMVSGFSTAALLASGCSDHDKLMWRYPHAEMETFSESSSEHYHRASRVAEWDRRGLAEDLDLLFMTDRPSRLTKWQSK